MVQGGRWGAALAQGRRRVEPADEQLRVRREAEALRAAPDDAGHEGAVAHAVLDKHHGAECEATIEEFVKTPEDQEAVLYFGVATCHQFYYVLEAMYERFLREKG